MDLLAYDPDDAPGLLLKHPAEVVVTEVNAIEPRRSWVALGRKLWRVGMIALTFLLFTTLSLQPLASLLPISAVVVPLTVNYVLTAIGLSAIGVGLFLVKRAPEVCHYRLFLTNQRVVLQSARGRASYARKPLVVGMYLLIGALLWSYVLPWLVVPLSVLPSTPPFSNGPLTGAWRVEQWLVGVGGALVAIGLFLLMGRRWLIERDIHLSKLGSWDLEEKTRLDRESTGPSLSLTLKLLAALAVFSLSFHAPNFLYTLFDMAGLLVGVVLVLASFIVVLLMLRRPAVDIVDRKILLRSLNGTVLTVPFVQSGQTEEVGFFLRNVVNTPSRARPLKSTLRSDSLADFADISGDPRGLVHIPTGRAGNRSQWNRTIEKVLRPISPLAAAAALTLFYTLVTGMMSEAYLQMAWYLLPLFVLLTTIVVSAKAYELLRIRRAKDSNESLEILKDEGPKAVGRTVYAIGILFFLVSHLTTTSFLYTAGVPTFADPAVGTGLVLVVFAFGALMYWLLIRGFNQIGAAFGFTEHRQNVRIGADLDKFMRIETMEGVSEKGSESSLTFASRIRSVFHRNIVSFTRETVGTYYRPWIALALLSVGAFSIYYSLFTLLGISPLALPLFLSVLLLLGVGVTTRSLVVWKEPDRLLRVEPASLHDESHSLFFRWDAEPRGFASELDGHRIRSFSATKALAPLAFMDSALQGESSVDPIEG